MLVAVELFVARLFRNRRLERLLRRFAARVVLEEFLVGNGLDHSALRGDRNQEVVREIAGIVAETFPGCALEIGTAAGDNRSYRVSFAKIRAHLPAFRCRHDVPSGARQLRAVFEGATLTRETFESRPYTRLRQLEHLIASGQIDRNLFWTVPQTA